MSKGFGSASDLAAADWNHSSDPYVEAFVWSEGVPECAHVYRSQTRLGTLSPSWDEEVSFKLPDRHALLHLLVFDWDRVGADDLLGEALLDLDELALASHQTHTLKVRMASLAPSPPKHTPLGHLFIQLTLSGLHEPPSPSAMAPSASGGRA